uniref:Uncharacterized protein n=1 Tax=Arundo donax TaxID=35708 RepID=A0A0A9F2N0_ARUDO
MPLSPSEVASKKTRLWLQYRSVGVHVVEALRELDEGGVAAVARVEHEAHSGAELAGVVVVVVAVEVDDEGRVGEQGRHAQLYVHGAGLLLVVVAWPLLPRDVHQHREAHVHGAEVQRVLGARRSSELRLVARMVQNNLNNGIVLSFRVVFNRLDPSARPLRPVRHERRPCTSTTAFTTVTLARIRPLGDDGEQRLQPGLELLVLPPHAPPVADELPRGAPGVRPVHLRRREVALGSPRLDAVLPAERRPQRGEPWRSRAAPRSGPATRRRRRSRSRAGPQGSRWRGWRGRSSWCRARARPRGPRC